MRKRPDLSPVSPAEQHTSRAGAAVLDALQRLRAVEEENRVLLCRVLGVGENDLRALELLVNAHRAGVNLSPKQLAAGLGIASGSTTALLDRLERAGHLTRVASVVDRRALLIEPAADTMQIIRHAGYTLERATSEITDRLGADGVRAVLQLCTDLAASIERMNTGLAGSGSADPRRPGRPMEGEDA